MNPLLRNLARPYRGFSEYIFCREIFHGYIFREMFDGYIFREMFHGYIFCEMFHGYIFREKFHGYIFREKFHGYIFQEMFHGYIFQEMFHGYIFREMFHGYIFRETFQYIQCRWIKEDGKQILRETKWLVWSQWSTICYTVKENHVLSTFPTVEAHDRFHLAKFS